MAGKKRKMYFKTEAELAEAGQEWRERLGLDDWFISVRLAETDEMSDRSWAGQCESDFINKSAYIKIRRQLPDGPRPQPHEEVLIHELLHCKFLSLEDSKPTVESLYFETIQHSLLEDMAKALYCAKYNLPLKYFADGGDV